MLFFLYSSVAAAFGALILAIGTTTFSPIYDYTDILIILSMSFFGGFGVVLLMYAFRNAPSSVLAPFSYFGLINAFLLGWIFLERVSNTDTISGSDIDCYSRSNNRLARKKKNGLIRHQI